MALRTAMSANSGSPAPRTVVTPLASCCWALPLRMWRTMARPMGLWSFFMSAPASPAETGLPEPHRCTCMLMRPGMRYAPARSMTSAPAGACATALGPIQVMTPRSTATAISGCGSICSEPSRTVALINNVGRSADAISDSSPSINMNICSLSPSPVGLLQTYRLTEKGGEYEGGRESMQPFPSGAYKTSQSVTDRPVFSR